MKYLLSITAITCASPAAAQMDMSMPGMEMPAKTAAKPAAKPKPAVRRAPRASTPQLVRKSAPSHPASKLTRPQVRKAAPPPRANASMPSTAMPAATAESTPQSQPARAHDMSSMPGMDMSKPAPVVPTAPVGHDMSAMAGMDDMQSGEAEVGDTPAPAPPADHAADAIFGSAEMASSREALRRENGAFKGTMILFNLAEYQARKGGDGYRWEGEAWFGGDINRLQIKTQGEGRVGKAVEDFEVQALYSRAISPFWNAQVGVRHDIMPNPSRTYAVVGVEGIAPYWFRLTSQLFLSNKGDLHARLEASYDERITQWLILQPRAEVNLAAQDVPAIGVGSGLSTYELGARLRYEIRKEFAPYVGVEWSGKSGNTARYARLAGNKPNAVNFVAGIRFWF